MELRSEQDAEVNPYTSPRGAESPGGRTDIERRERNCLALGELGWPSFFLMLFSALWAGNGLFGCLLVIALMLERGSTEYLGARDLPIAVAMWAPSVLIFYGAWCMRRGLHYRLALATSFMACFPCMSPVVFLGIPFGFWALTVLTRPHVRSAFGANYSL